MNKEENKAKAAFIMSMFIFGTIGIFRRYIPLPSGVIAMTRGFIGMLFIIFFVKLKGKNINWVNIKGNMPLLPVSGALIGFNWILLFEAYRYTSVAVATLCYYMAPVFVILASPLLFRENISVKKLCCVAAALAGMVLVSGVYGADFGGIGELKGVLCGLGAAVFYACVVILNKFIKNISPYEKTAVQLGSAGLVVVPYVLYAESMADITVSAFIICMVLIVGIFHTGFAYVLFFGSMAKLKAQTIALFSYIDPVVAIILSVMILHEGMSVAEAAGAVLILCAAVASELPEKEMRKKND